MKKHSRNNVLYGLKHIKEKIDRVIEKSKDCERLEALGSDSDLQDILIRNFEVIGEASNNISEDYMIRNSNVNCRKLIGMRHILIHQYDKIDYKIIWKAVKVDIPILERQISQLIEIEKSKSRNINDGGISYY